MGRARQNPPSPTFGTVGKGGKKMGAIYRMHMKRLFTRREFFFVVTALMVILTGGYIENCLNYYSYPADEVNSAAVGWIWNMDYSFNGVNSARLLLHFLFGILAALVYGDALYTDRRERVLQTAALRTTKRDEYVISGAAAAFTGAFLIFFGFFVLSQLLAFVEFPVASTYYDCGGATAWNDGVGWQRTFPTLFYRAPYLHNLIYMVYSSFWAGIFAFLSYTASLFLNNRLLLLALPQLIFYLQTVLVESLNLGFDSMSVSVIRYMYPMPMTGHEHIAFYILAPFVTLGVLAAIFFGYLSSKKKEVFL